MRRLAPVFLLGLLAFTLGDEPPSGFDRFVAKQSDAAKAFGRKKDWAGAAAAWRKVLELDPNSLTALAGVADAVAAGGNKDAELQARYELADALSRVVATGQKDQQRALDAALARIAVLDPEQGRTEALLVDYSNAQRELAKNYETAGLPASAIVAWGRRAKLVLPGSPDYVEAAQAIDHIKRTAPSYVAERFDPVVPLPTRDAAWIAEQDKKSVKFSSCLKLETAHYRIKTNAGWRMLQAAASAIERVNVFYREIWGIQPDPKPDKPDPKLREVSVPFLDVNIFSTRYEYTHRAGEGDKDWSGGHYTGSAVETYDQGEGGGKNGIPATLGVLFHECSHQFMDICVGGVPSFVNEGVASLFEGIELLPNGDVRRDLPVAHYLQPLAQALRDGTAKPLRTIFNAGENEPEQYKYRWGVFYFVRMFVFEGRYPFRDRLVDYMYDFKKGDVGDKAAHFEKFFLKPAALPSCTSFDEFEKVWKKWILDLDDEQHAGDKRLAEYRTKAQDALALDPAKALAYADRALDIDPDDMSALSSVARAGDTMGIRDRALATWRRVLDGLDEDSPLRPEATTRIGALDPLLPDASEARRALAGGMASLAHEYDEGGQPLSALRCERRVLEVDPFEPAARAMVTRLERDTGFSVQHWQLLCNGFDLRGWYGTDLKAFAPVDAGVDCDSSRRVKTDQKTEAGALLYQTLLCTRQVQGDWSLEARIKADKDWRLVGLVFGAKDSTHYEAIALRKGDDGVTRIDHGAYVDEVWTFPHTDGALKSDVDPTAGVLLHIDVRGRNVSASLDGKPIQPFIDKQAVGSVKYPLAALKGDIGLLASGGVTRFTDVRLLAGAQR
jgi:tetratricopeptide (TPR) repeat protein